jgi:hypothetical protein
MNLVLRKQPLLVLLAWLTLVVVSLLLLGTVAHVDLWHLFNIGKFAWSYPR